MFSTNTMLVEPGSLIAIRRTLMGLFFVNVLGCANVSEDGSTVERLSSEECETFSSLLIDPEFQTWRDTGSAWRYKQHTGAQSFDVTLDGAELAVTRIGTEPWAIYTQKVSDSRLSGRVVRYSAEVKGNLLKQSTQTQSISLDRTMAVSIDSYSDTLTAQRRSPAFDHLIKNGKDWSKKK